MKKLIAVFLILLTLCSCGSPDDYESEKNNNLQNNDNSSENDTSGKNDGTSDKNDTAENTDNPETVAAPLSSLDITPSCAKAMNPVDYFGDAAVLTEAWQTTGYWTFNGTPETYEAVKKYAALLTENYDFQLVAEPYEDVLETRNYTTTKFEYTLKYSGNLRLEDNLKKGDHTSNKGDIVLTGSFTVYSTNDEDKLNFDIRFNTNLKVIDEGYRLNGDKITRQYCGDSFGVGLIRNADGSFETTDGRFKAAVGEAILINDGVTSTHTTFFNLNSVSKIQEITVSNKLGIYQLAFAFPITKTLTSGEIFDEFDLLTNNYLEKPFENLTEKAPDLRNRGFHILHGEKYYMPQQGMLADIKQVNMRIMYVDETYSVAVIYFCADFSTTPTRTEGLLAVQLNSQNGGMSSGNSKVYNMKVGENLEIEGPFEYGAMYNLHTWSFISGSEYCEMHHTNLRTVNIIAHKPGTVRIKVAHEYTEEEYDSLLGTKSDEPKKATTEYVIYISE